MARGVLKRSSARRPSPRTTGSRADRGRSTSPQPPRRGRDALWFLTRQWQLGELQAEDAASPMEARLGPGSLLRRVSLGGGPPQPFDAGVAARRGGGAGARSLDAAGALEAASLPEPRADRRPSRGAGRRPRRVPPRRRTRLAAEADTWASSGSPRGRIRRRQGRREPHAGTLAADLGAPAADVDARGRRGPRLGPARLRAGVRDAAPSPGVATRPARLRRAHRGGARKPRRPTRLTAPRYAGGRLDWYDFDAAPAGDQLEPPAGLPARPRSTRLVRARRRVLPGHAEPAVLGDGRPEDQLRVAQREDH